MNSPFSADYPEYCQCGNPVEPGNTLCQACQEDYERWMNQWNDEEESSEPEDQRLRAAGAPTLPGLE